MTASFDDIERISGTLLFTSAEDQVFELMVRLVDDTAFDEGSEEFALVITYVDGLADMNNVTTVATILDSHQGAVLCVLPSGLYRAGPSSRWPSALWVNDLVFIRKLFSFFRASGGGACCREYTPSGHPAPHVQGKGCTVPAKNT
jgi:hypothetical protein